MGLTDEGATREAGDFDLATDALEKLIESAKLHEEEFNPAARHVGFIEDAKLINQRRPATYITTEHGTFMVTVEKVSRAVQQ